MDHDQLTLTGYRFIARCALMSVLAGFLIDGLTHESAVDYWLTMHSGRVLPAQCGSSLAPYELWAGLGFTLIAMGAPTRRLSRYSTWPFLVLILPAIHVSLDHWSLTSDYNSDSTVYVTPAGEHMLAAFTALLVAAPTVALTNHVLFTLESAARRRQSVLPAAQVTSRAARPRSPRSPTDRPASPSD